MGSKVDTEDQIQPGILPSKWRYGWFRRATSDPALVVSGAIVAIFVIMGLFAPVLAPYPYTKQDLMHNLEAPLAPGHWLGTDELGRDVFSRLLYGMRTSLYVATVVTVASVVIGLCVGLAAGYYRGRLDGALSSLMDIAWGFPMILVAIVVIAIMGPGITPILVGISVVNWAGFARIVRTQTMALRERDFVDAARVVGSSDLRILVRHILPNTMAPTLIMASFYMGIVITLEASLSFIGLGAQPPLPSLGQMVNTGRDFLFRDVWLVVVPGVTLAIIVLAFNQIGDSLRDLLDPTLKT